MNEETLDFIGVKVPQKLVEVMDQYISRDTHLNRSDFIRNAIKEKIQRDMPDLWQKLLKGEIERAERGEKNE